MKKLVVINPNVFQVIAYPKCIALLAVLFLMLFIMVVLIKQPHLALVDYLIFCAVPLIVIAILPYRVSTFDNAKQLLSIQKRYLWFNKTESFAYADIDKITMSYGKGGNYARGGALVVWINDKSKIIIDSDICFNNAAKVITIKDDILHLFKKSV